MEHTPTPWKATENILRIYTIHTRDVPSRDNQVACVNQPSDAAFIVQAVNSHEALVSALQLALKHPGFERCTEECPTVKTIYNALKLAGVK
jgi:hypothetical protein